MDLALNNLQRLICHKTKTNKEKTIRAIAVSVLMYCCITSTLTKCWVLLEK